jgi:predicted lipid-binding transport protein (Tim44 family)
MVTTNHNDEQRHDTRHLRGYWSGLLAGLLAGLSIGGLSGAAAMVLLTPHTGKATRR